ncbi:MAG: phosphoribosyltransferase family protein [Clostridia bacterium]
MTKWLDKLIQLIFPYKCTFCSKTISKDKYICTNCITRILSKYVGKTRKLKGTCDRILYVTGYKEIKNYMLKYKFNHAKYLSKVFAALLIQRLVENKIQPDYITFVPINKERLKERGYNQVESIANIIADFFNKESLNIIVKSVDNKVQSSLNKQERTSNVIDIFEINKKLDITKIQNKKILLLDDVFTTGATLKECVRTIKKSAKCNIDIAVVALNNIKLIEVK